MAATRIKLGLVNVSIGAIADDGGMGTALSPVGDTVTDSFSMSQSDNTITPFKREEGGVTVASITSAFGDISLAWSSYNLSVDNLVNLFGGTKVNAVPGVLGVISTTSNLTPGTGYSQRTALDVPLTGGSGSGAIADIVVDANGTVTSCTITNGGIGYAVNDTLSCSNFNLGGTGTGFSIKVASITSTIASPEMWQSPDQLTDKFVSLKAEWEQGGYVQAPKVQLSPKLTLGFKRSAPSTIDIKATVLQPDKVGEPRLTIAANV